MVFTMKDAIEIFKKINLEFRGVKIKIVSNQSADRIARQFKYLLDNMHSGCRAFISTICPCGIHRADCEYHRAP